MTAPDIEPQPDLLHFARDVYARPGIQSLCLRLQDEHNIDVVLLLMCCWHGCSRGVLSEAELAQAAAFSDQWRVHLVQPLRQARRWLKPHPAVDMGITGGDQEKLRERIKALELDAEFMQLRALAGLFTAAASPAGQLNPDPATAIRANLLLYARQCAGIAELDDDTLSALTQACLS